MINSFFEAIAKQVDGNQRMYQTYKEITLEHLKEKQCEYMYYVNGDYQTYLNELTKVDHLVIKAFREKFQVNIQIYRKGQIEGLKVKRMKKGCLHIKI